MNARLIIGQGGAGSPTRPALVRTGAAVCAVAAGVMAGVGMVGDDPSWFVRAAIPALVGIALLGMMLFARYPVVPLAFIVGGLIAGSHWLYGSAITRVPAMVGMVVVGAVLAVLVDREHRWRYLAPWGVGVAVAPYLWLGVGVEASALAALGVASFLLSASLAVTVRNVLVQSERRYRNLLNAVPVAVFEQDWACVKAELARLEDQGVVDLRSHLRDRPDVVRELVGRIRTIDSNPAAVAMFGAQDPDEVSRFMDPSRIADDDLRYYVDQFVAMAEGRTSSRGIWRTSRFDGRELWLDVHWVDTSADTASGMGSVVVAATDVTALKMSERSKDLLIESLSHELRTPLTAVLGFARLLSDGGEGIDEAERAEMLESITREGMDLANIVDDLLTIAKIERRAVRVVHVPVDLRAQIAQVLEAWDPADGARIRVVGPRSRALGDPARIRQILRHLVTNARRHGGSDITVELWRGDTVVGVRVCDDGPGVPPGDEERIFEPHHRAHEASGLAPSLGVGLTISRHLARLMDGDLGYHREDDRTVFELALPAMTTIDGRADAYPAERPAADRSGVGTDPAATASRERRGW